MQELIEKLAIKSGDSSFHAIAFYHDNDEIIKEALEKEKEQIIEAWDDGDYAYFYSKETGRDFANGEEYYNEKYKKE